MFCVIYYVLLSDHYSAIEVYYFLVPIIWQVGAVTPLSVILTGYSFRTHQLKTRVANKPAVSPSDVPVIITNLPLSGSFRSGHKARIGKYTYAYSKTDEIMVPKTECATRIDSAVSGLLAV